MPTKAQTEVHKEDSLILALSHHSQAAKLRIHYEDVSKRPALETQLPLSPHTCNHFGSCPNTRDSGSVMPLFAKSPSSTESHPIPSEQGQDFIRHLLSFVSKTKQTKKKSLTVQLQRNFSLLSHQLHAEFPETGCTYLSQPSNPQDLSMRK